VSDVSLNACSDSRYDRIARGEAQLSTVVSDIVDLLGNPAVGIILGLACAAGLFFVSRSSFSLVTPDDAGLGLALVTVSLFGRLAVATLLLWGYKQVAPSGFKPFALSLAGGFFVLYTIELVRYSRLQRNRKPSGAAH
jgi:hypothetical protein